MVYAPIVGLDYAQNRYYASGLGRFSSADPYRASAKAKKPGSWNRYSYTSGDPVNRNDPGGLCDAIFAGITQSAANSSSFQQFADDDGAISIYPYSSHSDNSSLLNKVGNVLYGIAQVAAQAFGPNSSTYAGVVGLELASLDGNPINVVTFSGGAAALTSAVSFLSSQGTAAQTVVNMLGQITYVAPGNVGSLYNNGNVSVIGGGVVNSLVGVATGVPSDATRYTDTNNCGHSFACLAAEFPQAFTSGDSCSNPAIVNQDSSILWRYYDPFYWQNLFVDQLERDAQSVGEDGN